jgi:hypothetical protein
MDSDGPSLVCIFNHHHHHQTLSQKSQRRVGFPPLLRGTNENRSLCWEIDTYRDQKTIQRKGKADQSRDVLATNTQFYGQKANQETKKTKKIKEFRFPKIQTARGATYAPTNEGSELPIQLQISNMQKEVPKGFN